MIIDQLKPKQVFHFNGVPLIVRRLEKLGCGHCRVHVRLDGMDGSVKLPGDRRLADVAEPVKFRHRRRKAAKKPQIKKNLLQ